MVSHRRSWQPNPTIATRRGATLRPRPAASDYALHGRGRRDGGRGGENGFAPRPPLMEPPAKHRRSVGREITERLNGAGYALFVFVFAFFAYYTAKEADWRVVAVLLFGLLVTVLELGYRLSKKQ